MSLAKAFEGHHLRSGAHQSERPSEPPEARHRPSAPPSASDGKMSPSAMAHIPCPVSNIAEISVIATGTVALGTPLINGFFGPLGILT